MLHVKTNASISSVICLSQVYMYLRRCVRVPANAAHRFVTRITANKLFFVSNDFNVKAAIFVCTVVILDT